MSNTFAEIQSEHVGDLYLPNYAKQYIIPGFHWLLEIPWTISLRGPLSHRGPELSMRECFGDSD